MSKLDEIKADVEGMKFATKGHAYPGIETLLKDIEQLLPIVEAAAALNEPLAVTDGQTATECVYCGNRIWAKATENQHAEDCLWVVLQNKLKTLD